MSLRLANITFDCDNTLAVAEFWSAALDRPLDPDPSEHFASIGANPSGDGQTPSWYFSKVPEGTLSEVRSQAWQVGPPL